MVFDKDLLPVAQNSFPHRTKLRKFALISFFPLLFWLCS